MHIYEAPNCLSELLCSYKKAVIWIIGYDCECLCTTFLYVSTWFACILLSMCARAASSGIKVSVSCLLLQCVLQ